AAPARDTGLERRVIAPAATAVAADRAGLARQGRIRIFDLGHATRGETRRRRIVAGQVGVVRPRETAPGRLDLGRRRAALDAEDAVWVSLGHRPECRADLARRGRSSNARI